MITIDPILIRSDLSGVIGLEHASYLHKLSTFPPNPITVFMVTEIPLVSSLFHILPVKKLDKEFTLSLTETLLVTTPERTICDLIRYDREERFIFESLDKYQRRNSTMDGLRYVANKYAILHLLEDKLSQLDKWLEDFYE